MLLSPGLVRFDGAVAVAVAVAIALLSLSLSPAQ